MSFCCKAASLTPPITSSRDEIYIAAVPLRATTRPAQLFTSTAYSLNLWDFQHYMVIIKPFKSPHSQDLVFDFQPQDPENILVAVAALSGRKVPGVVLTRKLQKLPKRKCWFVGYSDLNAVDAASKFNERWETDLRIGLHDCRNYANGLVEFLTGKKAVLEHLRESSYGKT
ncbi:uncharacterized protein LOC111402113 [Olea europaea var. sylvestris]|uniref:Uncharacterized protein n=1 Tax=Olea europaea subsp. europaea TaxID=158383 RepID=A0A8S0QF32_OLEEU|nr:uncharacterized protein LOC111402113 [Olea europaea var. sylvestris]CAA2965909.1 Hypothetical predicted protein [Olea europaea subsp. europaea]